MTTTLIQQLSALLPPGGILQGEDVSQRKAGIWRDDLIDAQAILRPQTTEQVSAILKICHGAGQTVVTHGGLTGLVAGADSRPVDIVLSMENMNRIEEIDETGRTMTVQAGVPLQAIQEAAENKGLLFALDLGARGSCTIGGNVATNAGGNRVIRYGMTRTQILGLEAVLADGTIISSMNKMLKNNAGYDLKQLFIGTEGTLGVVTRLVVKLQTAPSSHNAALLAVNNFNDVVTLLNTIDGQLAGSLSAFEVLWHNFYRLVTTAPALAKPPLAEYPYYVLLDTLGADQQRDQQDFQRVLEHLLETGLICDAVIAKSQQERDNLWALRDDVEQVFRYGPAMIFDVSLAIADMEHYVSEVLAQWNTYFPDGHFFTFGHLGDGNLHFVACVGEDTEQAREKIETALYKPLGAIKGSISAEHGIGLEKKAYLQWCRSHEEMALMKTLKRAMDPTGILNPHKVFDL